MLWITPIGRPRRPEEYDDPQANFQTNPEETEYDPSKQDCLSIDHFVEITPDEATRMLAELEIVEISWDEDRQWFSCDDVSTDLLDQAFRTGNFIWGDYGK